jgi:hypothetical protein
MSRSARVVRQADSSSCCGNVRRTIERRPADSQIRRIVRRRLQFGDKRSLSLDRDQARWHIYQRPPGWSKDDFQGPRAITILALSLTLCTVPPCPWSRLIQLDSHQKHMYLRQMLIVACSEANGAERRKEGWQHGHSRIEHIRLRRAASQ